MSTAYRTRAVKANEGPTRGQHIPTEYTFNFTLLFFTQFTQSLTQSTIPDRRTRKNRSTYQSNSPLVSQKWCAKYIYVISKIWVLQSMEWLLINDTDTVICWWQTLMLSGTQSNSSLKIPNAKCWPLLLSLTDQQHYIMIHQGAAPYWWDWLTVTSTLHPFQEKPKTNYHPPQSIHTNSSPVGRHRQISQTINWEK